MDAPRELAPDDPLEAEWLNQLVGFVMASQVRIDPNSGLVGTKGANGQTIGMQGTDDIWIKLTYVGVSGSYSWVEQVAAPGGGWTDGFRKGFTSADSARGTVPADPAWEASGNAGLPTGRVVLASRDAAVGRISFQSRAC